MHTLCASQRANNGKKVPLLRAIFAAAMAGQPGFEVRAAKLEPHVLAKADVRNLVAGSTPDAISDPALRNTPTLGKFCTVDEFALRHTLRIEGT
jgi:hypothetical protein